MGKLKGKARQAARKKASREVLAAKTEARLIAEISPLATDTVARTLEIIPTSIADARARYAAGDVYYGNDEVFHEAWSEDDYAHNLVAEQVAQWGQLASGDPYDEIEDVVYQRIYRLLLPVHSIEQLLRFRDEAPLKWRAIVETTASFPLVHAKYLPRDQFIRAIKMREAELESANPPTAEISPAFG
jgi:hypothetical protein